VEPLQQTKDCRRLLPLQKRLEPWSEFDRLHVGDSPVAQEEPQCRIRYVMKMMSDEVQTIRSNRQLAVLLSVNREFLLFAQLVDNSGFAVQDLCRHKMHCPILHTEVPDGHTIRL